MFVPPRCPNRSCRFHRHPERRFYRRRGRYWPQCRSRPVPRFQCRACRRGFSRQTFRADYWDRKPHLNVPLFSMLVSGSGLRQCGRILGLSKRSVDLKFRKIARHLAYLHHNLTGNLREGCELQMDEFETYEGRRTTRPLTVPVLIDGKTMFIVAAGCAPIPASGRMTPERRAAIAAEARRRGRRRDGSRIATRRVLRQAAAHCKSLQRVVMRTDEKVSYRRLIREAFGRRRVQHLRTSSKEPRTTYNPLFRINLTEAMCRDNCGRLHRRSWLVSKKARYLTRQLKLYMAYRNYHRPRFNFDRKTPAQLAGFVSRGLRKAELLSWRQDWGPERSPHPLSRRGASTVRAFANRRPAA